MTGAVYRGGRARGERGAARGTCGACSSCPGAAAAAAARAAAAAGGPACAARRPRTRPWRRASRRRSCSRHARWKTVAVAGAAIVIPPAARPQLRARSSIAARPPRSRPARPRAPQLCFEFLIYRHSSSTRATGNKKKSGAPPCGGYDLRQIAPFQRNCIINADDVLSVLNFDRNVIKVYSSLSISF